LKNGIDVSYCQKVVDWPKVKAGGVDFALIRVGYSGYAGEIHQDTLFKSHLEGAIAAGLDVGVYVYAYNKNPDSARKTARDIVQLVKPYKLAYPIAFDIEETKDTCLTAQGKSGLTDTVIAFIDELASLGYLGMWYTYTYFVPANLDQSRLAQYECWIADYRKACGYTGDYGIWQYVGDSGRCEGVEGACDRNIAYKDYPGIIRAQGLNGFEKPTKGIDWQLEYTKLEAVYNAFRQGVAALLDNFKEAKLK
jgi:GH25 family lysozyme M1 (1,4-beta-N-acetylmuramidase)